jgi:hypothetical protein
MLKGSGSQQFDRGAIIYHTHASTWERKKDNNKRENMSLTFKKPSL